MKIQTLQSNEAGNVLIYILGAILLLGLLVVMVKGSSTPGSNIDKETLILRVNEVQQYGEELERAIAYIMQNGHSETDIRFAHPDAHSDYGDITNTPTRQVFSRRGGGATYRTPPTDIQTTPTSWIFSGSNIVGDAGSGECNPGMSSCVDLTAILMNVSQKFCIEVNKRVNLGASENFLPVDQNNFEYTTLFNGSYVNSREIIDSAPCAVCQHLEGCVEGGADPANDTYHYYRVLLAR